ncbi:MAG: hypothetical protein P4L87_15350 [Formivibrio sp.]|nr:hypothetical protein [Formivibrio sp.]
MRTLLVCFIALMLLAACAAPILTENGRLLPPPGQGYVIAAVTVDSLNHNSSNAGIHLEGANINLWPQTDIDTDLIHAPGIKSDSAGKVYVIALPPGNYRVSQIYGSAPGVNFGLTYKFPLDERFELEAGQVVYLGDYHMSTNFEPHFSRSDTRHRDFNDLTVRYGITDFSNVTVRLPQPHTRQ